MKRLLMSRYILNVATSVMISVSVIVVGCLMSPIATAQSSTETQTGEPTLQESLLFITGKVNAAGCKYDIKDTRYGHSFYSDYVPPRSLAFDGKKGSFIQVLESTLEAAMTDGSTRKKEMVSTTKYEFNLNDLSATSVKLVNLRDRIEDQAKPHIKYVGLCFPLEIHTHNDEMSISRESSSARDKEKETNMIWFYFHDEDTAKRVAQAFAHAIKLSGGKKESF